MSREELRTARRGDTARASRKYSPGAIPVAQKGRAEAYMNDNGKLCTRQQRGPLGIGLVSVANELKATGDTVFDTVATIPEGFYGKLTLSFENGKVVMINKSENIKPGGGK